MTNTASARRASSRAIRAIAFSAVAWAGLGAGELALAADPVIFSFATVGDSRTDPAAPDATTLLPNFSGTLLGQDKIWLQNTKAFSRILRGVQQQKAQLLFFNGDMIYGYGRAAVPATAPTTVAGYVGTDLVRNYTQYAYWRGMVGNSFETGTYIIPVPGNHETQCNRTKSPYSSGSPDPLCAASQAYSENEDSWRANMGDLVTDLVANTRFQTVTGVTASNFNNTPPTSTAANGFSNGPISGSQTQLTYSFDIQTPNGGPLLHFAVVNTDPSGADGIAPADWLAGDFAAAKARGASKFFVFGHKPAFTYNYQASSGVTVGTGSGQLAPAGLDATSPISYRDNFWHVVAQYNATYFCGHEHAVNIAQWADPVTTNPSSNTPYQVLVGSGGSAFDDKLVGCPSCIEPTLTNYTDRYYAWALVQVHQSGSVSMTVTGFSDSFGPNQTLSLYNVSSLQ